MYIFLIKFFKLLQVNIMLHLSSKHIQNQQQKHIIVLSPQIIKNKSTKKSILKNTRSGKKKKYFLLRISTYNKTKKVVDNKNRDYKITYRIFGSSKPQINMNE